MLQQLRKRSIGLDANALAGEAKRPIMHLMRPVPYHARDAPRAHGRFAALWQPAHSSAYSSL